MVAVAAEPRASAVVVSGESTFSPRGAARAIANASAIEARLAPEVATTTGQRATGFVDRLLRPHFTMAQHLGGVSMFARYQARGFATRALASANWLFPTPWYQDEPRWHQEWSDDEAAMTDSGSATSAMTRNLATSAPRDLLSRHAIFAPGGQALVSSPATPQAAMPRIWHPQPSAGPQSTSRPSDAAVWLAGLPQLPAANSLAADSVDRLLLRLHIAPEGLASFASEHRLAASAPAQPMPALQVAVTERLRRQLVAELRQSQQHEPGSSSAPAAPTVQPTSATQAAATVQATSAAQVADVAQAAPFGQTLVADSHRPTAIRNDRVGASGSATAGEGLLLSSLSHATSDTANTAGETSAAIGRDVVATVPREHGLAPAERPAGTRHLAARHRARLDAAALATAGGDNPALGPAASQEVNGATPLALAGAANAAAWDQWVTFAQRSPRNAYVAAGPAVRMPAGLGGLVAQVDAAINGEVVARALSAGDVVRAARVLSSPTPAVQRSSALGRAPADSITVPGGFTHVAWSDRWLARFAGASRAEVASFALASPAATLAGAAPRVTRGSYGGAFETVKSARGVIGVDAGTHAHDAHVHETTATRTSDGRAPLKQATGVDIGGRTDAREPLAVSADSPSSDVRGGVAREATAGAGVGVSSASAQAASLAATRTHTPVDDEVPTSDEEFAAIAAAAAGSRQMTTRRPASSSAPASAVVRAAEPAEASSFATNVVAPRSGHAAAGEPALADNGVSAIGNGQRPFISLPHHPGLQVALAASPFANSLRALTTLAPAPAFDVRGLLAPVSASVVGNPAMPGEARTATLASANAQMLPWVIPSTRTAVSRNVTDDLHFVTGASLSRTGAEVASVTPGLGVESAGVDLQHGQPAVARGRIASGPSDLLGSTTSPSATQTAGVHVESLPTARGEGSAHISVPAPSVARPVGGLDLRDALRPGGLAASALAYSTELVAGVNELNADFVTPEMLIVANRLGLSVRDAYVASRLANRGDSAVRAASSSVDAAFVQLASVAYRAQPTAVEPDVGATHVAAAGATDAPLGAPRPHADGGVAAALAQDGHHVPAVREVELQNAFTALQFDATDRGLPRGAFVYPAAALAALRAVDGTNVDALTAASFSVMAAKRIAEWQNAKVQSLTFGDVGRTAVDARMHTTDPARSENGLTPMPFETSSLPASSEDGASGRSFELHAGSAVPQSEGATRLTVAAQSPSAAWRSILGQFEALLTVGPSGTPAHRAAAAVAFAQRSFGDAVEKSQLPELAWRSVPLLAMLPRLQHLLARSAQPHSGGAELPASFAGASSTADAQTQALDLDAVLRAMVDLPGTSDKALSEFVRTLRSHEGGAPLASTLAAATRVGGSLASWVAPAPSRGVGEREATGPLTYVGSSTQNGATERGAGRDALRRTRGDRGQVSRGGQDVPAWFDTAVQKMFGSAAANDSASSGGESISIGELVMVNTAPPAAVAASTRGEAPTAAPIPHSSTAAPTDNRKFDVEQIARDVYRAVLQMLDAVRDRNGEPYL